MDSVDKNVFHMSSVWGRLKRGGMVGVEKRIKQDSEI
jgi:hypothetical protein